MTSSTATDPSAGLDLLFAASQLKPRPSSSCDSIHNHPFKLLYEGEPHYTHPTFSYSASYDDVVSPSRYPSSNRGNELSYNSTVALNYYSSSEINSRSFVQVLMDLLNTADYHHGSVIFWVPDGKSFLIADQNRFEKEILPTYFRGTLFNSFVRKLNRWGFRRLKRTGHISSFAHDLFRRDKPWLCSRMKCQSKPNFKKVPAKVKDDARQNAHGNAATDFSISPVHEPPASGGRLVSNSHVMHSLPAPQFDVTNIPPPLGMSKPSIPPSNMSNEELRRRQLLIASIAKTSEMERQFLLAQERQLLVAQMQRRRQLQIEMQRLNEKSRFLHSHTPLFRDVI